MKIDDDQKLRELMDLGWQAARIVRFTGRGILRPEGELGIIGEQEP